MEIREQLIYEQLTSINLSHTVTIEVMEYVYFPHSVIAHMAPL